MYQGLLASAQVVLELIRRQSRASILEESDATPEALWRSRTDFAESLKAHARTIKDLLVTLVSLHPAEGALDCLAHMEDLCLELAIASLCLPALLAAKIRAELLASLAAVGRALAYARSRVYVGPRQMSKWRDGSPA